MSERSLCVYIMTSVVEYVFLHDDRLLSHYGYAKALSCEKFYREMYSFLYLEWFQLNWCSFITAIIFSGRFAAEWYIQIWIWCQKQTFWLKHLNLYNICHSHHYSWWLGTILGGQCSIGKHYFSFSGGWGIWPLLISSIVMPIFIYWAESGHCFAIGTFGFHRVHL